MSAWRHSNPAYVSIATGVCSMLRVDPPATLAVQDFRRSLSQSCTATGAATTAGRGWIAICEATGLTRSMSRKGRSCDNARAEGFFGLLKQEFFHGRDWSGVGAAEFSAALDEWMRWFRSGRISQALGWLTPDERRLALGYAV